MSTAGATTGELPAGEDGWPSTEQTPPMPSWCGGVSEVDYTMEGKQGFERQLCSVDLVKLYLDRISRHNPALSAFVQVLEGRALAQARKKDAAPRELKSA